MRIRTATSVAMVTLMTGLAFAADKPAPKPAPASWVKLESEQIKLVAYNAKDPCMGRRLMFSFRFTGAGKHHYDFAFSTGGGLRGGDVTLSPGGQAGATHYWTYNNPSKDAVRWLGIRFDGGPETHLATYHDTCQR